MQNIDTKIKIIFEAITAILSTILGEFWFLFVFLLGLNVIDYITGILKARYLKKETSKKAMKGFIKKFLIWVLIILGFGLGLTFKQVGEIINIKLDFMISIGWFILIHCIVNELRSILENIVELDRGHLVPNWLINGLEVTHNMVDKRAEKVVENLKNKDNQGNK